MLEESVRITLNNNLVPFQEAARSKAWVGAARLLGLCV
jgi:hypothetical protein